MNRYQMDLISHKAYEVESATPQEALKLARAAHPDYAVDRIIDGEGLDEPPSMCEGCGVYMLPDDIACIEPEDGNYYCKDCYGAILDDQANYSADTITLCKIYNEMGEITDYDDAEKIETVVNFLKAQNHSAESIACYLQLHSGFCGHVPDLAEALIENGICTF